MEERDSEAPKMLAWEVRLAALLPLSAAGMGALISAFLTGVFLALDALLGEPFWVAEEGGGRLGSAIHAQFVFALLIGYTIAAGRYLPVAIFRDLQQHGREDPAIDLEKDELQVLRYPSAVVRKSRYAGAVGALVGLALHSAISIRLVGTGLSSVWLPALAWGLVGWPFLGWLLARAAFFTAVGALGTIKQPWSKPRIDLLNLQPLIVEGRIGLRLSLVWLIGLSITSLALTHPQVGADVWPLMLVGVVIAIAALLLPVRGMQRRIRIAKIAELVALDGELRRVRDAVMQGDEGEPGRLADLLSYRSYVEGVRELPFDNTTFARFGLYLLIPLASWVGGAFVERLLGSLLD